MNKKNTTKSDMLEFIRQHGRVSAKDIVDFLGISRQALFQHHLTPMVQDGILKKIGKPPHVFYSLANLQKDGGKSAIILKGTQKSIIEKNFLYITPRGERLDGVEGFVRWCQDRSMNVTQKAKEYEVVFQKYNSLKNHGLLSGKKKISDTFKDESCLEDVLYADFYAWEIFGKTKLGQLLLYGKQSQDRKIMLEVIDHIKPLVEYLIQKRGIDAAGFIPPTVKREVQFMNVLEKELKLSVPLIEMVKVKTDIITPQKTLSKLQERIDNAEYSIVVTDKRKFKTALLIDDAVGSGATLNQVACKMKKSGVADEVYGFSITGSVKGFDVISEI